MKTIFTAVILITLILTPAFSQTDDRSNARFSFNIAFALGFYWGDLNEREKKNKITYTFPDGYTGSEKSSSAEVVENYSAWVDYIPFAPVRLGPDNMLRLCFRIQYEYIKYKQIITVTEDSWFFTTKDEKTFDENLMKLHSLTAGPVIQLPLFDDSINSNAFILNLFARGGPIYGTLRPFPASQELGVIRNETSRVKGIRLAAGFGVETPEFHQLHAGLNIHYAYNRFTMHPDYYTDYPSRSSTHETGIELYAGISF